LERREGKDYRVANAQLAADWLVCLYDRSKNFGFRSYKKQSPVFKHRFFIHLGLFRNNIRSQLLSSSARISNSGRYYFVTYLIYIYIIFRLKRSSINAQERDWNGVEK
jgi:hypothetical protein